MPERDGRASPPTRRRFLTGVGAGGLVGLSGCLGALDGSNDEPTPTGSETGVGTPTATAAGTWEEGGPPDRGEWTVTFADRFESGALDTERWSYGMGGGTVRCPPQDGPNHCWAEDHAWVDGETDRLVLQASDEEPDGDADYTFGAVTSDPGFAQEYGYFEAKCRMDATTGTLPAFWMLSDFTEHRYRELTFEARGIDDGESIHFGYYVQDEEGTMHEPTTGGWDDGYGGFDPPLDEAFHLLGIEWRPDSVAFHVDGEEVQRWDGQAVTEHFPGAPMYLICNHGVMEGGEWVGWPHLADFPSHHELEWVRAWQLDEEL